MASNLISNWHILGEHKMWSYVSSYNVGNHLYARVVNSVILWKHIVQLIARMGRTHQQRGNCYWIYTVKAEFKKNVFKHFHVLKNVAEALKYLIPYIFSMGQFFQTKCYNVG